MRQAQWTDNALFVLLTPRIVGVFPIRDPPYRIALGDDFDGISALARCFVVYSKKRSEMRSWDAGLVEHEFGVPDLVDFYMLSNGQTVLLTAQVVLIFSANVAEIIYLNNGQRLESTSPTGEYFAVFCDKGPYEIRANDQQGDEWRGYRSRPVNERISLNMLGFGVSHTGLILCESGKLQLPPGTDYCACPWDYEVVYRDPRGIWVRWRMGCALPAIPKPLQIKAVERFKKKQRIWGEETEL